MTYGLLDLSIVTDQLLDQLRKAKDNTRLWDEEPTPPIGTTTSPAAPAGDLTPETEFDIEFTGLPPDAARELSGTCKVSLYLFHVAPDKYWRNTFPQDRTLKPDPALKVDKTYEHLVRAEARPRRVPQQPFALTLYYLLSAHSKSYIEEQQAMSIALKCFHDQSIVTATVPKGLPENKPRKHGFTLTMEPETVDDIGRLWQSITTPLRLSAVYRANVIFLEPEQPVNKIPAAVVAPRVIAYPHVTGAIARKSGRVTVWGANLDNATLTLGNTVLTRLPGKPAYPATQPPPPPAGSFQMFDNDSIELRLPSGTPKGYVRLRVTIDQVETTIGLQVPENIP